MKKHKIMEKKNFFSDKKIILNSIKSKNKFLSKNIKVNIIKEKSNTHLPNNLVIKNASINSKIIKKNDIFLQLKEKKLMVINLYRKLLKKNLL